MEACRSKTILLSMIATLGLYSGLRAQEQTQRAAGRVPENEAQAAVTLGSTSGTPGESIVVPIYFTSAKGVEVGDLKVEITYVSANLKFSKLEAGSDAQGIDLHSDVKEAKNEKGIDTQTLRITASVSSSELSKKGIPPGLLAYIIMTISEKGRSASITLHGSAEGNELGSKKPSQRFKAFETAVVVFAGVLGADPTISCFFFTH